MAEDGLERVALGAAGRADVGLAAETRTEKSRMSATTSAAMPGPLSATLITPRSTATSTRGATPASSQASRLLSTSSLTATCGHCSGRWPIWAVSSRSEAKSSRREVRKVSREARARSSPVPPRQYPDLAGDGERLGSAADLEPFSPADGGVKAAGSRGRPWRRGRGRPRRCPGGARAVAGCGPGARRPWASGPAASRRARRGGRPGVVVRGEVEPSPIPVVRADRTRATVAVSAHPS